LMLAAYAGCITMRAAAVLQYAKRGRSMVAGDMIEVLGDPVLQHCSLLPESTASAAKL
jgi:NAD(P)H-hydrate repair Nnr-like enzyme with NAD(P)H-hydrate dehydratase domain